MPVLQVAQGHKKKRARVPPEFNSSEFYTKEGTEVLENATILFAFVCLFRQQIIHTSQSILFYPREMEIIGTAPMCWNIEVYPLEHQYL